MTEWQFILYLLPKVAMATVCGIIVGFEREVKQKIAGIRTHVLICVGVCLFASVPSLFVGKGIDPTRVIGQIITGIGFLGAGVIFKHDEKVVGVTSAAFIWFIASIGVIIGLGYLLTGFVLTIGLLFISMLLLILENKLK